MHHDGRTALITGASSGIGRELAQIHAERGGDLVVVARREEELNALRDELVRRHGATVHVVPQDLSDPEAAHRIADAVSATDLEVEILINNAGFGGRGRFHERPWETDRAMIQVNIVALTALTRLFLPHFVKRGHGRVLNVSSTASLVPGPLQAVYYATKAYVTSFSLALHEELRDTGVSVTALLPGATDTEFADRSDMDETALFEQAHGAREVAEAGYEAMLDGHLQVIAGVTLAQKAMMKAAPILPKTMVLKQVREMQEV